MMRNKRGRFLMIAGVVLLLFAGALSFHNIREEEKAALYASQALAQLQVVIPALQEESESVFADASESEDATVIAQAKDEDAETTQMRTIQIENESYIGVIKIPSLKLELPVMSEWSYPKLIRSPCRYTGSYLDDTLVIAGHSVRAHFRGLRKIQTGASVVLTDVFGNDMLYEVVFIETLAPNEVDRLIRNEYDLTLFTCTPGGRSRVTARCNRVQEIQ
jgi:sortase A